MITPLQSTVHLLPGQSVSLVTGKITSRLSSRNEKGLRANYLVALQLIIEADQMIPSVNDLEEVGAIFHS